MKPFAILVSLLLGIVPAIAEEQASKIAESELRALEGEYTFNPSDTDEMATVHIKFRRSTEKEHGEWVADGTMDNSFHGTVVTFPMAASGYRGLRIPHLPPRCLRLSKVAASSARM